MQDKMFKIVFKFCSIVIWLQTKYRFLPVVHKHQSINKIITLTANKHLAQELSVLYKLSQIKSSRDRENEVMALVCRTSRHKIIRGKWAGTIESAGTHTAIYTVQLLSVHCASGCMKKRHRHV